MKRKSWTKIEVSDQHIYLFPPAFHAATTRRFAGKFCSCSYSSTLVTTFLFFKLNWLFITSKGHFRTSINSCSPRVFQVIMFNAHFSNKGQWHKSPPFFFSLSLGRMRFYDEWYLSFDWYINWFLVWIRISVSGSLYWLRWHILIGV